MQKRVQIAIQARTDSQRLPGKIDLKIAGKTILQRVIDNCEHAATFINRQHRKLNAICSVCVICPEGDRIKQNYQGVVQVIEGPGEDVLRRYAILNEQCRADYIVRVTADCIFNFSHMISRHIKTALIKEADYTTNTIIRTTMEGTDTEVISSRLLTWLDKNATEPEDREHVTTYAKKMIDNGKFPFPVFHVLEQFDLSHLKTSIDTRDEYQKALQNFEIVERKKRLAKQKGNPGGYVL